MSMDAFQTNQAITILVQHAEFVPSACVKTIRNLQAIQKQVGVVEQIALDQVIEDVNDALRCATCVSEFLGDNADLLKEAPVVLRLTPDEGGASQS